jgi:hypothetical protein
MMWKPALNAFAITFDGRINPGSVTAVAANASYLFDVKPLVTGRSIGKTVDLIWSHDQFPAASVPAAGAVF